MGATYLRGYSIDCILVSFIFCMNSYFSGQGNSWFPMVHSLITTFYFVFHYRGCSAILIRRRFSGWDLRHLFQRLFRWSSVCFICTGGKRN